MKDELKDLFQNKPPEVSPPKGHEDRFIQKLIAKEETPKRRGKGYLYIMYAAASVAVLLIIGVVANQIDVSNDQVKQRSLADVSLRTSEMERLLIDQVNNRVQRINQNDPEIQHHVERYQKLEQEFGRLEIALNQDFGNQRIVDAMIKNYKLRVRILEQILLEKRIKQRNSAPAQGDIQS